MTNWESLWSFVPDGLLLDENGDGLADGAAACIVPLTPQLFPAAVWAACANLAVRIGLESPAVRLPLAVGLDAVESWQTPILISMLSFPKPLQDSPWLNSDMRTVTQLDDGRIAWLDLEDRQALWVEATTPEKLADLLNSMANAGQDAAAEPSQADCHDHTSLNLSYLYSGKPGGFYVPAADGFTPYDTCVRLLLPEEIREADAYVAIDLAARIGLETAGASLPLVSVATGEQEEQPGNFATLRLGVEEGGEANSRLVCQPYGARLTGRTAAYLASTYPYLSIEAQRRGSEEETVSALLDRVRHVVNGHPPAMKLALAHAQSKGLLPVEPGCAADAAEATRQVFRYEWDTPDGENNVSRLRRLAHEIILPYLTQPLGHSSLATDPHAQLTLFCSAPLAARSDLAAEIEEALARSNCRVTVRVLPVHKSALAWMQEEQLPQLEKLDLASVDLIFREFRPEDHKATWLDLPTRWLQEWFPVKDVVCASLGLAADDVHLRMAPADEFTDRSGGVLPTYRVLAYDSDGEPLYEEDLYTLAGERSYLEGAPQHGLVHPATGGAILTGSNGLLHAWYAKSDEEHFWDFYQQTVLPALRAHVLDVSGGRPTPDSEPYFERVEVDGYFGWPDEELDVAEEFVSIGEALHEDIYFNTLDYLAALGEDHCGRPIVAAGQVIPLIHDYMQSDGSVLLRSSCRATVTLRAWHVPYRPPGMGTVAGDARDLPRPRRICVEELDIDDKTGDVTRALIDLQYTARSAAHLAGRTLANWQAQADGHAGTARGVEVVLRCMAGPDAVCELVLDRDDANDVELPVEPSIRESDVIGPLQLNERLKELSDRPEVTVWALGQSYQGRTGYAVDVHLPLAAGQTHYSRLKLALQKPTCFIIARHHANEVSSTTAALDLIADLAQDPAIRSWLDRVNLVFLPMANPDGAALHYRLMAEHPRWKHHAARFNAAGMEFSIDAHNPDTAFGEARFRRMVWQRWLPDTVVDNHGVPSHEWCQPFAGYNSPPRFRVSYHVVQAMIYGIIIYVDDPQRPELRRAAEAMRARVAQSVASEPSIHNKNQFWLDRYHEYGHRWLPETSPMDVHHDMLFFFRGVGGRQEFGPLRGFSHLYPEITLVEWITEVPDETAQGEHLMACATAHRTANLAMIRLVAESAQPAQRTVVPKENGTVHVAFSRKRRIDAT